MYIYALTLLFVCAVHGQDEGQVCAVQKTGEPGVCKSLPACSYAKALLYEDELKPPMCRWNNLTRIVCCPNKYRMHNTGVFRGWYRGVEDGIKRSQDITCRYDGKQPMLCCKEAKSPPERKEPAGCGPVFPSPPRLRENNHHVAWEYCKQVQRYANKCVADVSTGAYKRVSTCVQDINRVAGGRAANLTEFPHMAVLGCHSRNAKQDIHWIGGGSLINERFILTAAHVLFSTDDGIVRYAMLGALRKDDIRNGMLYNIILRIAHKFYDSVKQINDIALLKLDRKVVFSEFIRPICLPVPSLETESGFTLAGWGQRGHGKSTSAVLWTARLRRTADIDCITKLDKKDFVWDKNRMICAAGSEEKGGQISDSCEGDSGGPLMSAITLPGFDCSFVVRGVVSHGKKCGEGGPGAYAKVESFLDWIVENAWPERQ